MAALTPSTPAAPASGRKLRRACVALRVALALCAATFAAAPLPAEAFCGFYIAGADTKLFNNATLVVLMRDGMRTVLSMQNNYQGPAENFAMVVPVPIVLQKENVKTLPREVFDRVDKMAAPRLVEYWEQDPCAERNAHDGIRIASPAPAAKGAAESDAAPLGVKIEAQFTVGEYEIVILSAKDSGGLDTWLRQEKYEIPEGAEPLLRPYVASGMKFFVAKVDASKVRFEKGMAMLSPLRFHYDTDSFALPVRLGLMNSSGTQDLIVHVFAKNQRYEVANYPNVTIPTNLDVSEAARDQFGAFYAALFDATLEKNPKAVVTEYAWAAQSCDPCPGPTLTPNDLVTLGADVLPSNLEMAPTPGVTVQLGSDLMKQAPRLQWLLSGAFAQCYGSALQTDRNLAGTAQVHLSGDSTTPIAVEVVASEGFPPKALGDCLQTSTRNVRAQSEGKFAGAATVNFTPMPNWQATSNFVLTRLHARYGKDSLGEDLIFRQAGALVGGREMRDQRGQLEHGGQPSSTNNFQARYAIRHSWEGPMACAQPKRGVWGGPPAGHTADAKPKAATDLAFAPRGGVKLSSFLRQDVPEIGMRSTAGGCGCRTAERGDARYGALALAALASLFGARRARRRAPRGTGGWVLLSAFFALGGAAGCAGKAEVTAKAPAPEPAEPVDSDGDGIPDDGTDKCLLEKEDGLPPDPKDGCLSSDADGDGIPDDGTDHCRGEKEDKLPPDPKDGCKTTDPDHDGILGKADECPEEAETPNDYKDDDGCPDKAPRVRVTKSEVKITEKILFAFAKATIEKASDDLLDEIAKVINESPQIEFIEVAGHADKIGNDPTNVQLTKQRAAAVQAALAQRRVDRRRMRPQGYGRYCPLDPGDSEEAREKNRRVEFKIMKVDGVETGVALGCEEAAKHGIRPAGVPRTAPKKAELERALAATPPPETPDKPKAAPKQATPPKPASPAKPAVPAKPKSVTPKPAAPAPAKPPAPAKTAAPKPAPTPAPSPLAPFNKK